MMTNMTYSNYSIEHLECKTRVNCKECSAFYDDLSDGFDFDNDDELLYYATDIIVHSEKCHFGSHQGDYYEWCPTCVREATESRDDPAADHMMTEMRAMKDLIDDFPTLNN